MKVFLLHWFRKGSNRQATAWLRAGRKCTSLFLVSLSGVILEFKQRCTLVWINSLFTNKHSAECQYGAIPGFLSITVHSAANFNNQRGPTCCNHAEGIINVYETWKQVIRICKLSHDQCQNQWRKGVLGNAYISNTQ